MSRIGSDVRLPINEIRLMSMNAFTHSAFRRLTRRSREALRALLVAGALLVPLATPGTAHAQYGDEEGIDVADARLRGYEEKGVVVSGKASIPLAYFAFIGLTLVAAGVMFKSARRTHLD